MISEKVRLIILNDKWNIAIKQRESELIVKKEDEDVRDWCISIAGIIVDAMLDAQLVEKEKFEDAVEVVSLELFCSMSVGDYPPPFNPKLLS